MANESQSNNMFSPNHSEELVSFLKENAEGAKTPLQFVGSSNFGPYGYEPQQELQPVSLTNMNQVIDYPFKDMTITVEAGITIAELQKTLAENNQRLPIDVPFPEKATLGGAIAANVFGSRGYQLGTWRDYVIGMSAVDGQGRLFKSGGRVVKNVAGYDLAKLMIGSHGTLGAISQVTLQVRPVPEQNRYLWITFPDFKSTEKALSRLVSTDTIPVVVDVLNATTALQIKNSANLEVPTEGVVLVVGYEGNRKEVDWQISQLKEELSETEPQSVTEITGEHVGSSLTETVCLSSRSTQAALEINVKPSVAMKVCEQLDPEGVSIQCHSKLGVIRVVGESETIKEESLRIRKLIQPEGGNVVLIGTSISSKEQFDRFDWNPLLENYMRQVKQKLDPHHLLSPGKLF